MSTLGHSIISWAGPPEQLSLVAASEGSGLFAPSVILANLPWILFVAWLTGRLLGVRHRPWLSVVVCAFAGWAAGGSLAFVMAGGDGSIPWAPEDSRNAMIFSIAFTMVATVGWELMAAPRKRPPTVSLAASFPHPIKAVRRAARRTRRYIRIVRIALKHGLGPYIGFRRGKDMTGNGNPARQVRLALDEAGGMFVKLGQMLSTRPELVTPAVAEELTRLQDHVSPADAKAVQTLVEQEIGRPLSAAFISFDLDAVAAASIAQAHVGVVPTGEEVVVKVQRPGIEDAVDCDLSILLRLARRVEDHTAWAASYGVSDIAAEFAENLRQELDFATEARNMTEMATDLRDVPEIQVPNVFTELSSPRLIVMERLHGVSVSAAAKLDLPGSDRHKLADILLQSALRQMMSGERFHADPHPGNVWLLEDGRLALLDFGSTGRLDTLEQASVTDMLTAIRRHDPAQLRDAVLGVATVRRPLDERALERALARFMARHLGTGAVPSAAMLTELLQIMLALGIAMPPTTTLLFRTFVTLEGTIRTLCPGYPLITAAEEFAADLVRERATPSTWKDAAQDELLDLMPVLRRAPRHLDHVATLIERGEARAKVSLFSDDRDVRVVGDLVNRIVLTVLGGLVGLMSVALLAVPGGPQVSGSTSLFDVFGYMGLFLATVVLLRALLAATRG
jgi:ubiquinone biosynthesis protein